MNTEMHGKEVRRLWLPDERVVPPTGGKLVLSATYHGDRDEFWILAIDKEGKELGRHNCKHIGSIEWA